MKNIYKYISILLMFSYLGVNAQVNFDTTLLKDNSVILYALDDYDRIVSAQFLESYSNSQIIEMQESGTSNDFGDEILLDYIHFPSPEKGTKPLAFCFNQQAHKYYIYGGNKVLVYNSLNDEFLSSITVAESQFLIDYLYPKSKSIVFDDSESKLIVITADNTMVYIDSNTDQIINTIDLGEYYEEVYQSIYLNKNDNVLYVTLSFLNSGNSILKKFNTNGDLLDEFFFNELLVYDLELIDEDRIYISAGGNLGGLYKINTSDLSDYELIKAGWFTEMVFAVNEQKLFCPNAMTNAVEIIYLEFDQYCCKLSNVLGYAFDAAYNSINGYVYFTGKIGDDYTRVTIDAVNEETFPVMQFAMGIHWQQWTETSSALYWTTYPDANGNNKLKYQYGNLPNSQTGVITPAKGFNREIGFNPDIEEVVCLNINNGLIESYNKYLNEKISSNITGGVVTRAVFNSINNKIYLLDTDQKSGNNLVAVYQADNGNLLDAITIVDRPKNMLYLEETNKLYISSSKYLYTIDGINNNITDSVFLGNYVGEILMYDGVSIWINNNGSEDKLVRIDPTTLQKNYIDIGLNTLQLVNGVSGFIYLFAGELNQFKVFKINKSTGIVWETDVSEDSFVMSCPADSSIITINEDNNLIKLDQNGNQQNDSYDLKFYRLQDALYYPKDNSIVVRIKYENENNLIKLNADDLSLLGNITLPSAYYQKLVLNTRNDRIYLHSYFEFSDFRSKILAFNPSDLDFVGSLSTGPKQSLTNRGSEWYIIPKVGMFGETMVTIPINNQMLIANIDFSSYSLVQCPEEERTFKNGWNWVSFPKLERADDNPVDLAPLLNTMEPMPGYMKVWHSLNTNGDMTWAEYDDENEQWTFDQLEDLQSTKGYKIEITDGNDVFQLTTPGSRLNPAYPISLTGNMVENWIGYYEYQSASDPFDALAFCLDNLRVIKMQNWSAYYEVIGIDKGIPIYGWLSAKPRQVKYGDMMIVQGINDCELIWNQIPKPGGKDLAEASYFEYEEQADYTTVFIELDENTDADEIGAFVGETCVGATVVEEGDEMVEIQAYLQGVEGDEMYFETHSTNKSAPVERPDYYVKDFNSMQYVNRKIRPYDQKPFHMVSFKNEVIENQEDMIVYHYPNPANDEVNIHFNLQKEQQVSLELMDINGKLIEKVDLGSYPMGTNEYSFKIPQALSKGIYLYKFITENTTVVNQLVIQ